MPPHEDNRIRERLVSRREKLLHLFNEAVIGGPQQEAWDMDVDLVDADDGVSLRMMSLMEELLEVDDELDRMREGGDGLCRRCGATIGDVRLEVFPEARICRRCAQEIVDEDATLE